MTSRTGRGQRALPFLLGLLGLLLVGCSSATHTIAISVPTPPIPTSTTSATSPTATAAPAPAADKAAPNSNAPPDFVLHEATDEGDKLKLEGRFGPVLPPTESDVNQETLSECPGAIGRELVTRLDVTVTLESNLSANVALDLPEFPEYAQQTDVAVEDSEGPSCSSGGTGSVERAFAANWRLQPHESQTVTMWFLLLRAVTPNKPDPTASRLAHELWLLEPPGAVVDNAPASVTNAVGQVPAHAASGPRIVTCRPENDRTFIALVPGLSSATLTAQTENTYIPQPTLCEE